MIMITTVKYCYINEVPPAPHSQLFWKKLWACSVILFDLYFQITLSGKEAKKNKTLHWFKSLVVSWYMGQIGISRRTYSLLGQTGSLYFMGSESLQIQNIFHTCDWNSPDSGSFSYVHTYIYAKIYAHAAFSSLHMQLLYKHTHSAQLLKNTLFSHTYSGGRPPFQSSH